MKRLLIPLRKALALFLAIYFLCLALPIKSEPIAPLDADRLRLQLPDLPLAHQAHADDYRQIHDQAAQKQNRHRFRLFGLFHFRYKKRLFQ